MAQTRSSQPNPARVGLNREQSRRANAANRGGTSAPAGRGGALITRRRNASIFQFIRDVRSELNKVVWPTRRETVNLTVVVIALSGAVGLFLGGVDFLFQEFFKYLLSLSGNGGF